MMDVPSSPTRPSANAATPQVAALEAGFVAHEAWAFEAAYTMHRRLLYGAAYSVLHDASDAEDCVHDVLVRLWQKANAYTAARGSLPAFLCVCVRNEALSRQRQARNRARIERDTLENVIVEPAGDDQVLRRMHIAQSLQSLSDPQREAIRLAYYDGLTHEQIARRLDQPVGTIKSRLSNALRVLRGILVQRDEV
jgi:RNA polymerase sigma-70 factor, ECF subfamily